jgi:hypothetical protein
MGATIINFIEIGGMCDISLLLQDGRAALNGSRSQTFCCRNAWGQWHLGRAWALARAQGCGPGDRPRAALCAIAINPLICSAESL